MRILLMLAILMIPCKGISQKYISKEAKVTFFSEAPIENITAVNKKATSILDITTGDIVFSVPINQFEFKKSLMKKHFNENYMDSELYPKSTFRGNIGKLPVSPAIDKSVAIGSLNIHGVTKKIEVRGEVVVNTDEIIVRAKFPVLLKDYDIKIPKVLFTNIAESVEVTVEFRYVPYVSN